MDEQTYIAPTEEEYIKIKADYDTVKSDLEKATKDIENLKAENNKLTHFIARYVSSDKPADKGDVAPKSFNELYNETIIEMAKKG